jgi:hypothetical protein
MVTEWSLGFVVIRGQRRALQQSAMHASVHEPIRSSSSFIDEMAQSATAIRTDRTRIHLETPNTDLEDNMTEQVDPIAIVGIIESGVTAPRRDGTPGSDLYAIPFQLSRRPPSEWIRCFLAAWRHPRVFTPLHRPNIARVDGDRIVLDGTTIHEVERVHRDTLLMCVQQANEEYGAATALARKTEAERKELERSQEEQHRQEVSSVTKRITFD